MYPMLAALLVAAVSAEPLKNVHRAPSAATGVSSIPQSSGKLLDSFSQSDLDFDQWIDLMVDEGQVYRPNTTDLHVMKIASDEGWTVTIKNVACSTVTGNRELLERAEGHFCDNFIKPAGNMMAKEMELDVMRLLCDNGTFCKLGVKSVFDFLGLFPGANDIADCCHDMFDALQNACPDGGGVADTEVVMSSGEVELGQLEFSYLLGNGPECMADATHECFDQDIP